MKKKNLSIWAIIVLLPFLFSNCKILVLTQNKIKIDDSIIGIWERTEGSTKSRVEFVKVNDYLVHGYDLSNKLNYDNPKVKITFHEIANYKFASLDHPDGLSFTLYLSSLTSNGIMLKRFKLKPDHLDESFDNIKDSSLQELVFTSLVEKYGVEIEKTTIVYRKLYVPAYSRP